jgi:hypothetical protein
MRNHNAKTICVMQPTIHVVKMKSHGAKMFKYPREKYFSPKGKDVVF